MWLVPTTWSQSTTEQAIYAGYFEAGNDRALEGEAYEVRTLEMK
jgi:hypothetical protein